MTIIDVDNWSKQAAMEFLTNKVPLNDSIIKIASSNGLNRDQVNRVVEAANTEVYVNLFNKASDKYIEYETADSEKIASVLYGETKTADVHELDYENIPEQPKLEDNTNEFEKTAEHLPTTNTEDIHDYYKLASLETRIKQSMDEVEVEYNKDASILFSLVKQAVLGGTSFGDIESALTAMYNEPVVRINIDEVHEKIAQEIYPAKLNEVKTTTGTVNPENNIVKQAGRLVKHAQEYSKLKKKHEEAKENLKTHLKTSGVFSAVGKAIKGSVGGSVILTGTGAIGGGVAVDQITKKRAKQEAMSQQMHTLPNAYRR